MHFRVLKYKRDKSFVKLKIKMYHPINFTLKVYKILKNA